MRYFLPDKHLIYRILKKQVDIVFFLRIIFSILHRFLSYKTKNEL